LWGDFFCGRYFVVFWVLKNLNWERSWKREVICYIYIQYMRYPLFFVFFVMTKKTQFNKVLLKAMHKIARYTKHQKIFVLYLFALVFFLLFFPIMKVIPVDGNKVDFIFLISGSFFKTMVLVLASLAVLLAWNMSFRFKNFVINIFGFKENDSLFNFIFLWIITTAYLSIGDATKVVRRATSTIDVTAMYYFVQLLLLVGLILTLVFLVKKVKSESKTKIVNLVNEDAVKEVKEKKTLQGLFGKAKSEE